MVCDMLRGSENEKITSAGLDRAGAVKYHIFKTLHIAAAHGLNLVGRKLRLFMALVYQKPFDRKNLYFEVRSPADRYAALKQLAEKYSSEGRSGIVYCSRNVLIRLIGTAP